MDTVIDQCKAGVLPHNAKALEGNIADVKVSQIETAGILDIHTVIAPAVDDKAGHGGIFRLVQNNGFVQRFIAGGQHCAVAVQDRTSGYHQGGIHHQSRGDDLHRAVGVGCQKVIQFCQAGTGKIHSLGGFGGGQGGQPGHDRVVQVFPVGLRGIKGGRVNTEVLNALDDLQRGNQAFGVGLGHPLQSGQGIALGQALAVGIQQGNIFLCAGIRKIHNLPGTGQHAADGLRLSGSLLTPTTPITVAAAMPAMVRTNEFAFFLAISVRFLSRENRG